MLQTGQVLHFPRPAYDTEGRPTRVPEWVNPRHYQCHILPLYCPDEASHHDHGFTASERHKSPRQLENWDPAGMIDGAEEGSTQGPPQEISHQHSLAQIGHRARQHYGITSVEWRRRWPNGAF